MKTSLKWSVLLVVLLVTLSPARGQDFIIPEMAIVGAEKPIDPGELVALRLSNVGKPPAHWQSYSAAWKILDGGKDKPFVKVEDGIFFGAGLRPRKITALVAVSHLYVEKDGDKIKQVAVKTAFLMAEITIGEPAPGPDPGPDPTPPGPGPSPDPVFPPGKFGLSKTVYDLAKSKVPATSRAKGAKAYVGAMQGVLAAVSAGVIKTPEDMLRNFAVSGAGALRSAGVSPAEWSDFGVAMQDTLFQLNTKNLKTLDDYKTAFDEMIVGLSAVK